MSEAATRADRYAVIGHPIGHSLSPRIHALFASQTAQHLQYAAIDVPANELTTRVRKFIALGGRGLSVTIPHKQAVMAMMDSLSERAQRAAAVNTVIARAAGLHGDNTDGVGLLRDLEQNLQVRVAGSRLLLLGAGGAARGVLGPLLDATPAELVIANRTEARALELVRQFKTPAARSATFSQLQGTFDLVINATAASLAGEVPALPNAVVRTSTVCYDMAYGREETPFVRWARRHGAAQAYDGLGMLVEQAAEAFSLWRQVRPQTAAVLAQLRQELARSGAPQG